MTKYKTLLVNLNLTRVNPETGGIQVLDENLKPIANEGGYQLPEISVGGNYKSSFNKQGATEFAGTVLNTPLMLGDYFLNRAIDGGKGEYGKTNYNNGTPLQTSAELLGKTFSPTKWFGTVRSGFKESPYSKNNPGFWGDLNLDLMTDLLTGPKFAKGVNKIGGTTVNGIVNNAKYTAGRKTWYAPAEYAIAHTPISKRAVEVTMRTTGAANPTTHLKNGIIKHFFPEAKNLNEVFNKDALKGKNEIFNKSIKSILKGLNLKFNEVTKYILTGKNNTGKPISLNERNIPYQGYGESNFDYTDFDIIDAYLYGKHPNRTFFKSVTDDGYTANAIKESIAKNYPNKKIERYETIMNDPEVVTSSDLPRKIDPIYIDETGRDNSFRLYNDGFKNSYDAAGHRMLSYIDYRNNAQYERYLDIWKFNPQDYYNKWIKEQGLSNENLSYKDWAKQNKLLDFGLNTVNEAGTPIVVRTPWMRTEYFKTIKPKKLNKSEPVPEGFTPEGLLEIEDYKNSDAYINSFE